MGEAVFFRNLTTKGLTAINSGERYFEGWLTVQVKDKQGEVTIVDELMKVLPVWIDRGAPISDTHSNRIIGKGINYSKAVYKDVDGTEYPAIKVTGKIHKNYELDNDIWSKIKSGEYKGLSFGGATKSDREPMQMKDGSIAYSLKDLEHYEVAVCRDPAVPLALITEFNTLAKSAVEGEDIGGGRMLIKCSKYGCYVDKQGPKDIARPEDTEYTEEEKNEMDAKEIRDQAQRVVDEDEKRLKHPMVQNMYKDNKEGGLKAPEARNEALVYDDKTLDQPSETPRQIPLGKGKGAKGGKEAKDIDNIIREIKDEDNRKDAIDRHATGDISTLESRRKKKKVKKKSDDYIKKLNNNEKARLFNALKSLMIKLKGEDWSNAGGDMHSMYNQDTDEGGMGKHKQKGCKCSDPKCKDPKCKHKREVGTGYGAEKNSTGEVGWSGGGSPYPKIVKSRLRLLRLKGYGKAQAIKRVKELQDKRRKESKKDGEYGGMNTGQVEWTEPRDTANDRRDSKINEVKEALKDAITGEGANTISPYKHGVVRPVRGASGQTKEGQATDARNLDIDTTGTGRRHREVHHTQTGDITDKRSLADRRAGIGRGKKERKGSMPGVSRAPRPQGGPKAMVQARAKKRKEQLQAKREAAVLPAVTTDVSENRPDLKPGGQRFEPQNYKENNWTEIDAAVAEGKQQEIAEKLESIKDPKKLEDYKRQKKIENLQAKVDALSTPGHKDVKQRATIARERKEQQSKDRWVKEGENQDIESYIDSLGNKRNKAIMKLKSKYTEDLEEHGQLGSKETDKDILDNLKRPYETRQGAGFLAQYRIGEGKRPTKNQVLGGHKGRGRVDLRERWHKKHPKRVKELENDPKKEYLRRERERAFGNTDFKEREAEGKAKWGMINIFGKAVMTNVLSRLKSMKLKARKQRKDAGTKKGPQKVTIISNRYGKGKTGAQGAKIGTKDRRGRIIHSTAPIPIKDADGKVIASASQAGKMRYGDMVDTKHAKEIEQMKNGTWTGLSGSEARRARYKKDAKYRKLVDDHLSGRSNEEVRDESIDDEGTAHGAT